MSDFFQAPIEETSPETTAPTETAPGVVEVEASQPVVAPTVVLETPHAKRERLDREADEKRISEFMEAVVEARKPLVVPPPQPSHPQILATTQKEMEEGKRQNALHEAQKAQRPVGAATPHAKEIAAQGTTSQVFRGHNYTHEKGDVTGKQLSVGELGR